MLVEQVLELNLPALLVLNMADELKGRGGNVNANALSEKLGIEVIWTNGRTGEGTGAIIEFISRLKDNDFVPSNDITNPTKSHKLPVLESFSKRKEAVKEAVSDAEFIPPKPSAVSGFLDSLVLHKIWGPMIFFAVEDTEKKIIVARNTKNFYFKIRIDLICSNQNNDPI